MNISTIESAPLLGQPRAATQSPSDPLRFSMGVALVVFATYFFTTSRLNENLQALGLFSLLGSIVFIDQIARTWWVWVIIALSLAAGIAMRPLDVPNHHILLTYIAIAIALCLSAPEDQRIPLLQHNARWLIVALMGIATLQRLFQPTFMSGDYISYEIVTGGFLYPLLKLLPETSSIIHENREIAESFRNSPPSETASVALVSPFPMLPLLAKAFVAVIIAIEAWICIAMWARPKWIVTHLSILAFAVSLAVIRQELTFISVVCMLGLLTCDPQWRKLRWTYGISAALFAAAVVKTVNLPEPLQ
ncbi:MAG: hypothetical protein AAGJ79_03290 [Verrucomicrobiota bacterium]